jgi:hypothetical protein
MLPWMMRILEVTTKKITQLRFALGIAAIAAAIAIAALFMRGYFSSIGGVVVAVNMGVMLMIAILMFVAAAKAKGQASKPYQKLYFAISCAFSFILIVSAALSLSSVFFHTPLDFRDQSMIEQSFNGDYRVEESVVLFDLRKRQATNGHPGLESRDPRIRIDRVVRQRPTNAPYEIQTGTNGLRIDQINSPTHPSMTTREVSSDRFKLTTDYTYISSIPADRFPIGESVTVQLEGVFINAFKGDDEEWTGVCPSIDTNVITMIVLFPKDKPCKEVQAMEERTGNKEVLYEGISNPVIHDGGSMVTWTIFKPVKGTGYFIAFK